jgi:hypothetical protein
VGHASDDGIKERGPLALDVLDEWGEAWMHEL